MKYMDYGCRINCWECNNNCEVKDFMKLSINNPLFEKALYAAIIETLKPLAGLLISQGKDPKQVTKDFMELAVSFYVARLKMIEMSSEN